jgi:hypothetical protein
MPLTAKSVIQRHQTLPPRDELPGIPTIQRSSLVSQQRRGTRNHQSVSCQYQPAADVPDERLRTDDLIGDDAPTTRPQPTQRANVTPLRTKMSHQLGSKNRGWVKITAILLIVGSVAWILITGLLAVISWGIDVSNTYAYGPTRTSVVSGVFGIDHDSVASPTSIVAINLKGTLVIESIPAGDVSKIKTYPTGFTMIGDTAAKLPVLLTIKDINGDHRPGVLIQIPGQSITLKLINNGNGFTLTK